MILRFICLLILIPISNLSWTQACGIYQIQYEISVKSHLNKDLFIQLPSVSNLHGSKKYSTEVVDAKIVDGECTLQLSSRMTSELFRSPLKLKEFYKAKKTYLPIIILTDPTSAIFETKRIMWNFIDITKGENDKSNRLFIIKCSI